MKMLRPTRRPIVLAAASLAALAVSGHARAQNEPWPSKPLRIIVGFPAGSSPDLTARALAEPLEKALGQPVIVDNRAGGGATFWFTLPLQMGGEAQGQGLPVGAADFYEDLDL